MKAIVSALIALSVLAGVAATSASAEPDSKFDAKKFWEQVPRN